MYIMVPELRGLFFIYLFESKRFENSSYSKNVCWLQKYISYKNLLGFMPQIQQGLQKWKISLIVFISQKYN